MIELERHQLPAGVQAAIPADRFLYAFAIPESGRYVVHRLTEDGCGHELEFDESLGRFLTVEERRSQMPPDDRFVVADEERLTVTQTYHIDADTQELRARFEIVDEAGRPVAEVTRGVFEPTPWRPEDVVGEAIRRFRFPERYASWPRGERVRYWADKLYRLRRARGESGRDEDDLYTPDLVRDMEQLDPRVLELLGDIVALVGDMEQTDRGQAIDAFERRSGIRIRGTSRS